VTVDAIEIDGCFNFRDAGGWPADNGTMRRGVLYRGDAPERLTDAGRAAVEALGLTCVVDLRQKRFVEMSLGFAVDDVTHHIELVDQMINYEQMPRLEEPVDLADMYVDLIGRCTPQLVTAVEIIAEHVSPGPVLVQGPNRSRRRTDPGSDRRSDRLHRRRLLPFGRARPPTSRGDVGAP
jgi:hypothetical protein